MLILSHVTFSYFCVEVAVEEGPRNLRLYSLVLYIKVSLSS